MRVSNFLRKGETPFQQATEIVNPPPHAHTRFRALARVIPKALKGRRGHFFRPAKRRAQQGMPSFRLGSEKLQLLGWKLCARLPVMYRVLSNPRSGPCTPLRVKVAKYPNPSPHLRSTLPTLAAPPRCSSSPPFQEVSICFIFVFSSSRPSVIDF